jgi:class 3 adenylate cyclase
MERRLAAILAADVVGYSRLMEQDEADTFERLRMHRKELFEPEIEKHHGRIFKLMGDGLLAEFGSVVDAVECAVTLQRGMAERNTAILENRRIDVRIGVNLGDVIIDGDDRHGEGVNIAARLEGLAEPGGIVISGTAYDHVKTKVAVGYSYVGEQSVKNIIEPVRPTACCWTPRRPERPSLSEIRHFGCGAGQRSPSSSLFSLPVWCFGGAPGSRSSNRRRSSAWRRRFHKSRRSRCCRLRI